MQRNCIRWTDIASNRHDLHADARDDEAKALRKQRKKEKKRAREVAERTAAEASTAPTAEQDAAETAAPKHKRKQAKKQAQTEPAAAGVAASDAAEEGDKAERKRRRKEEKRKAAAASQSASEGDGAAPASAKAVKQKGGKQGSPAAAFAAVGDVELAKRSKAIRKELYTEHAEVAAMSAQAVAAFQAERDISVEGSATKPVTAFAHLGFPSDLMHAVKGFKVPSPVQAQCWPLVLQGHDLIGIAATGSGAASSRRRMHVRCMQSLRRTSGGVASIAAGCLQARRLGLACPHCGTSKRSARPASWRARAPSWCAWRPRASWRSRSARCSRTRAPPAASRPPASSAACPSACRRRRCVAAWRWWWARRGAWWTS